MSHLRPPGWLVCSGSAPPAGLMPSHSCAAEREGERGGGGGGGEGKYMYSSHTHCKVT